MKQYVRLSFITFTIWLLSAFINGLLCGIFLAVTGYQPGLRAGNLVVIFFISLFFSGPGFFIFWIIILASFTKWVRERALFRTALSTGFILALITGISSSEIFTHEFRNKYAFIFLITLSAITSIMLHFNHFKKIN